MKNDPCGDESTDWLREARTVLMNLGDQTIAETGSWNHVIQHLMLEHQLTLSTAESCTGGFIASQLTGLPGSSGYFLGSVVSYANSVKQNVLGVSLATLQNYGAVSPQCAEEMLSGVLRLIGSNIGVAVTGIAGPGGGSSAKPVGTVYVCVGSGSRYQTDRLFCPRDRKGVVEYTYQRAMYMLYRFLTAQENQ